MCIGCPLEGFWVENQALELPGRWLSCSAHLLLRPLHRKLTVHTVQFIINGYKHVASLWTTGCVHNEIIYCTQCVKKGSTRTIDRSHHNTKNNKSISWMHHLEASLEIARNVQTLLMLAIYETLTYDWLHLSTRDCTTVRLYQNQGASPMAAV